ncbi:hypothetical protein K438DRAFT_1993577 [Mycena galopus ATCC 62051]|nr:hypothetical protein K438DRAFT_1993577 [Mycena galopus ATCC 62051]
MATLPPTTHSLPKPQRLRLMRSTRKLTALLGATPHLVDSDEHAHIRTLKPSQTPPTFASTSSIERDSDPAALVSVPGGSHSAQRPTLLLRINTVPSHATNRRRSNSQGWGRPASMAGSLPSPLSPTDEDDAYAVDAALAARRKKMARVARILGENVPPELVFGIPCSAPPRRTLRKSRESEVTSQNGVEEIKSRLSLEEARFAKIELAPLQTSTVTEPSSPRPSVSSDRVWFAQGTRRSNSHKRRRNSLRSTPVVIRTEVGWIGEWNQDERTVVKTLRELKQK